MIEKGQQFSSPTEALHAVQDHALAEKKSVRVKSQGGSHKFVACASPECSFIVRFYKQKDCKNGNGEHAWFVSSRELFHIKCIAQPKPTLKQVTEMVAAENKRMGEYRVAASMSDILYVRAMNAPRK